MALDLDPYGPHDIHLRQRIVQRSTQHDQGYDNQGIANRQQGFHL